MSETAYLIANASVVPVWLAMMVLPWAAFTRRLVATPLVPMGYAALYTVLVLVSLPGGGDGDMLSMEGLRISFERDGVLLLAWVHYLCFDMVVGMWEVRDARRLGLPQWLLAPCLLGTLMLGPLGFLAYTVARYGWAGAVDFDAQSGASGS